ncbi:EF-hand calcium-binding domain-containing protein 5 [Grus japonensis]|uniref:EF-hand calcium-binding domain-containing protein 5 n=1 Tax=Grus japonensis TaxID=30415 RepID=A0ABC9XK17_GRUJA
MAAQPEATAQTADLNHPKLGGPYLRGMKMVTEELKTEMPGTASERMICLDQTNNDTVLAHHRNSFSWDFYFSLSFQILLSF